MGAQVKLPPVFSPLITVKIEQTSVLALLDTGAGISVLSKGLVEHLRKNSPGAVEELPPGDHSATAANGTPMKFCGSVRVTLNFRNFNWPFIFLVSEFSPYDVLLGADFLRTYDWSIHMGRHAVFHESFGEVQLLGAPHILSILQISSSLPPLNFSPSSSGSYNVTSKFRKLGFNKNGCRHGK